jgi:polar amino acid transport system permease protein
MVREFTFNEVYYLVIAARWTVLLALIAFAGGGLLGMVIAAMRVSPSRALRWAAQGYIQFFQGTPLLIQLFMAFYGTAFIGLSPDPWSAAAVTFVLNSAAFFGEIFYGSIQSVPEGQWEASRSLGLRFLATLRLVILPQAARLMVPPTIGFMVQIVKGTSVASLIGLTELARTATVINTVVFEPALVFGLVALIYFALCWPLSLLGAAMERRLRVDVRRTPLERIEAEMAAPAVAGQEVR